MALSFHDLPPPVIFTHNETLHSIALPPLAEFLSGMDTTDRILKLHDILQRFRTPKRYHRVDVRFVESSELPPKSPIQRQCTPQPTEPKHRVSEDDSRPFDDVNGHAAQVVNGAEGEHVSCNVEVPKSEANRQVELSEEEKMERGWPVILPEGVTKADYLLGPEPPAAVDLTDAQDNAEIPVNTGMVDDGPTKANGHTSHPNGVSSELAETENTPDSPSNGIHSTTSLLQPASREPEPSVSASIDRPSPPTSPIPTHMLPPKGPRRRVRELRLDLRTLDAAALFALETWRRELLGLERLQLEHPDSVWYEATAPIAESSNAPGQKARGRKKERNLEIPTNGPKGDGVDTVESSGEEDDFEDFVSEQSVIRARDDSASEYEEDRPRPPRPQPAPAPVEANGEALPKRRRGRPRKIRPEEGEPQKVIEMSPNALGFTESQGGEGKGAGTMEDSPALLAASTGDVGVEDVAGPSTPPQAGRHVSRRPAVDVSMDGVPAATVEPEIPLELDNSATTMEIEQVINDSPVDRHPLGDGPADDHPLSTSPPPVSPVASEGEPELDSIASGEGSDHLDAEAQSSDIALETRDELLDEPEYEDTPPTGMALNPKNHKGKAEPKKDSSNFNFPSAATDTLDFVPDPISPTMDVDLFDEEMVDESRISPTQFSVRKRIRVSTDQPVQRVNAKRRVMEAVVIPVRTKRSRAVLRAQTADQSVRSASPEAPSADLVPSSGPSIIALSPEGDDDVIVLEPDEWATSLAKSSFGTTYMEEDTGAAIESMDSVMQDDFDAFTSNNDEDANAGTQGDSIDAIRADEWAEWDQTAKAVASLPDPTGDVEYIVAPTTEADTTSHAPIPAAPVVLVDDDDDEDGAGNDEWSFLR